MSSNLSVEIFLPMRGHVCERLGVAELFAIFRRRGVLNGLGSCGIRVEL